MPLFHDLCELFRITLHILEFSIEVLMAVHGILVCAILFEFLHQLRLENIFLRCSASVCYFSCQCRGYMNLNSPKNGRIERQPQRWDRLARSVSMSSSFKKRKQLTIAHLILLNVEHGLIQLHGESLCHRRSHII